MPTSIYAVIFFPLPCFLVFGPEDMVRFDGTGGNGVLRGGEGGRLTEYYYYY